ncbi:hypothetical protein [Novosphingobium aquimarinum]|uniref:hypothetical protein n=1 Tax=Novosphingobium aquimarinum TaxID=2682494 RepID=UPI0012EC389A|nr:hypothetical protein [Novosphingobium aquimarinum]
MAEERARQQDELRPLKRRADQLTDEHKADRTRLKTKQEERQREEIAIRARRVRTGLAGFWDRLTGKAKAISQQNQLEAWRCAKRDAAERDSLIRTQMDVRRNVQHRIEKLRRRHIQERADLHAEIMRRMTIPEHDQTPLRKPRGFSLDR